MKFGKRYSGYIESRQPERHFSYAAFKQALQSDLQSFNDPPAWSCDASLRVYYLMSVQGITHPPPPKPSTTLLTLTGRAADVQQPRGRQDAGIRGAKMKCGMRFYTPHTRPANWNPDVNSRPQMLYTPPPSYTHTQRTHTPSQTNLESPSVWNIKGISFDIFPRDRILNIHTHTHTHTQYSTHIV